MEEEKQTPNKIQKLKVRPNSTIKNVISKLVFPEQIKEYQIFIIGDSDLRDIFLTVNQKLSLIPQLTHLTINFQSVQELLFEDTIYQLSHLNQITNISLRFYGTSSFNNHQSYLMSQCLEQFSNLSTLQISLSCGSQKNQEKFFKLIDFFKKAPQLSSINFVITNIPERSSVFYSLLEGIRYLKNLKSLSIVVNQSEVKSYVVIDLLEDELKESIQLTELSLTFGYKILITNHDFHKLSRILKQLPYLEKLKLSANKTIKKQVMENIRLGEDMLSLKNLRQLNLTFESQLYMKYCDLIQTIATMELLENVILDFKLMNREQVNNNLLEFAKSLSKIQQLTQLSITFNFTLFILEVIKFVEELHPLQKLTILSISLPSMESVEKNTNFEEINKKEFNEVMNRLTKYSFKKNTHLKSKQDENTDLIYQSICNSINLEELEISINNYFSKNLIEQQTIEMCDFLKNKTKLKKLILNFGNHLILNENQLFVVLESLKYNLLLSNLTISLGTEQNIYSESLKELSESLIQLKELDYLSIQLGSSNEYSDEGMIYLTNSLPSLKKLRTFSFEICKDHLSQSTLNNFMIRASSLQKLRNFTLTITGQQFKSIEEEKSFGNSFQFSSKLLYLKLQLSIPNLQYKNLLNFFEQTGSLQRLGTLQLYFPFEIEFEDCMKLKQYFSNLKELKMLQLKNYSFQQLHLVKLFGELSLLTDIEFINDYRDMKCLVKASKSIKENEGNLKQEISLKIQNEKFVVNEDFEKKNAEKIIPLILNDLLNLTELKIYFIDKNNIGSEYSSLLFNGMKILKNLESLKIHIDENNSISTESINTLGVTLLELPKLKTFQLIVKEKNNDIVWEECSLFSHSLGRLIQLQSLDIVLTFEYNQFRIKKENEEALSSLFQGISSLSNLQSLDIVINNSYITQKIQQQFHTMCLSLSLSLKILKISFEDAPIQCFYQMRHSINALKNLNYLQLNTNLFQSLYKGKRLVQFKKLSYYYPKFDYI